jgi:hypothetical protein
MLLRRLVQPAYDWNRLLIGYLNIHWYGDQPDGVANYLSKLQRTKPRLRLYLYADATDIGNLNALFERSAQRHKSVLAECAYLGIGSKSCVSSEIIGQVPAAALAEQWKFAWVALTVRSGQIPLKKSPNGKILAQSRINTIVSY